MSRSGESAPGFGSADAEAPTLAEGEHAPERVAHALPRGTCLGRYVVLERIGMGGMGLVYAAYDAELNRKVALKQLREHAGRHERSLHEARALAKLSHPNVITVYGAETWNDDTFIAMELVEGKTLRSWLAERRRGWREIVAVFVLAGRGLAAAHAAKLVHRDVKPDNVLIGRDGRVRVTDFGLARSLEGDDGAPRTDDGAPGTLAYMAPEQHDGRAVDARSDQFGFCAALYEALHGELPRSGANGGPAERSRSRVRMLRSRMHVPRWLRSHVLRGLAADPEDRFPSMDALLGALTRDPWSRRKRIGSMIAGVAAVVTLGMYTWRAATPGPCKGSAASWAEVWNADRKAAIETAIDRLGPDPTLSITWASARAAIDDYGAAWTEIDREACEATHVRGEQSERMLALRRACLHARAHEVRALAEALASPTRALTLRAAHAALALTPIHACADVDVLALLEPPQRDADAEFVASVHEQLGRAKIQGALGASKRALALAEQAYAQAQAIEIPAVVAEARHRLGHAQAMRFDAEAAEHNLLEAQWLASSTKHDEIAARAATDLVHWIGRRLHRHEDGLVWARHAEAALARIHAAPEEEAGLRRDVGVILDAVGHVDEAEAALAQALALPVEDPLARIDVERSLADVYVHRGRLADAERLLEAAAARTRAVLGPEHPELAWIELGRAHMADAREDHGEALHRLAIALAIVERGFGPADLALVPFLEAVAESHRAHGDPAAAAQQAERVATLLAAELGEHPAVAEAIHRLALALEAAGQPERARYEHERALALWERTRGSKHADLAYALTSLGVLDLQAGTPARAVERLERALELRGGRGLDPRLLARTQFALARALHREGSDDPRARELASRARSTFARGKAPEPERVEEIDRFLTVLDAAPADPRLRP